MKIKNDKREEYLKKYLLSDKHIELQKNKASTLSKYNSGEYIKYENLKHHFKCKDGHTFSLKYPSRSLLRGSWCSKCRNKTKVGATKWK